MFITVILTIIIVIIILYWNGNFWKRQNVPGPIPLPIIGNILSILFRPLPIIDMIWAKNYGRVFGKFFLQTPILVISDPQLIKDICVKDFNHFTDHKWIPFNNELLYKNLFHSRGEDWKRLRSIMSPIFTLRKMKNMFPIVQQCIDEYLDHLVPFAENKQDINLKEMNENHTMNIIASCGFAMKTNAQKDPNNPFVQNGRKAIKFNPISFLAAILLPKPIFKLMGFELIGEIKSNNFFLDLISHLLKQRKLNQQNKHLNNFIQLLADAHDTHNKLTEEEIIAQGWLLFVAGFDTSASALTFSLYELALNPEIQEQLYKEIQTINSTDQIYFDALMSLPYLDAVLRETLRLYPPVVILPRTCVSDYILGDTGIQIKKGQDIEIPVYAIHTSEEFYEMPKKFIPDRFLAENRDKIKQCTYMPFGVGPRICVARQFALMTLKLSLAQIITKYRLLRSEQTAVPLKFVNSAGTLETERILVGIQPR